jgi:hypothetical protein
LAPKVSSQKSPELPKAPVGAPAPEYHWMPSEPAGPVGPGVPVIGFHADPSQTSVCPTLGPVADTGRPWIWVALPEDALVVE